MEIITGVLMFLLGAGAGVLTYLWTKNHSTYDKDDANVCPHCLGPSDVVYVNNVPFAEDEDGKELCIECMRPL